MGNGYHSSKKIFHLSGETVCGEPRICVSHYVCVWSVNDVRGRVYVWRMRGCESHRVCGSMCVIV